jgi:hypothetical protein
VGSAAANNNCGFNLLTGSNGKGYDLLEFSSGTPGANDVATNPNFVDAARRLSKWDTSLGGAGTTANALAQLRKRNDTSGYNTAYTINALLTYVRAGFRPTNVALKGTAHDGGDIGSQSVQLPSLKAVVCIGIGIGVGI